MIPFLMSHNVTFCVVYSICVELRFLKIVTSFINIIKRYGIWRLATTPSGDVHAARARATHFMTHCYE